MQPTKLTNCKCGSAPQLPVMKARGRWVVACSRESCPALVQAQTKQESASLWSSLSTKLN
jgi:hypothetical protein